MATLVDYNLYLSLLLNMGMLKTLLIICFIVQDFIIIWKVQTIMLETNQECCFRTYTGIKLTKGYVFNYTTGRPA